MTKIAIIQRPPVLLDRSATVAKAVQGVAEAAAAGASLIVFPESFIPGYPSWIWRLAAGKNGAVMGQLHARLLAHAVDIGGGDVVDTPAVRIGCLICWENYMPLARYALYAARRCMPATFPRISRRVRTCSPTPRNASTMATRWSSIRRARSLRARCAARPACCTWRSMWRASRRHAARSTSPGTTRAGTPRTVGTGALRGRVIGRCLSRGRRGRGGRRC